MKKIYETVTEAKVLLGLAKEKRIRLIPTQVLVLGFASIIIVGAYTPRSSYSIKCREKHRVSQCRV